MDVSVEFKWNPKVQKGLQQIPDDILYTIGKELLDTTLSNESIPYKTGDMYRSSASGGVRGSKGDYYIGSYTNYAKYVWNMPQSTNWTNKKSKSKWYAYNLKKHGTTIINSAITKSWRKDMQ